MLHAFGCSTTNLERSFSLTNSSINLAMYVLLSTTDFKIVFYFYTATGMDFLTRTLTVVGATPTVFYTL